MAEATREAPAQAELRPLTLTLTLPQKLIRTPPVTALEL